MSDELEHDRDVEELVDAADAEARADLRGSGGPPPFAAIVARAHRIDPRAVGTDAVGAVERPRVRTRATEDPIADPTIDAWVAAARAEAEHETRRHLSRPRPPMQKPVASAPRRWAMVGGGLLLAAVAVLFVGLRPMLTAEVDDPDAKSQALSAHERDDGPLPAAEITSGDPPTRARGAGRRAGGGEAEGPGEARLETAEGGVGPTPTEAIADALGATPPGAIPGALGSIPGAAIPGAALPGSTPGTPIPGAIGATPRTAIPGAIGSTPRGASGREGRRVARARAGPPSLVALDHEAQLLLAAGRLDAADRKLAELVRIGGSDRLVEAAYADRFTIAHRQRADGRQRQLWAEYLKRFPRGRFADDARAGLCRAGAGGDARGCWAAYVRDFPTGTYRDRADRALARSEPP